MGHSGQMTSDGFTMNYGKRISEPSFLPERLRDPQKIFISKPAPYFGKCWPTGTISFQVVLVVEVQG